VNGKPGDDPIMDICDYGLQVFSAKADALVKEIHKFLPRYRMWELFNWNNPPPLSEFEKLLEQKRDELIHEARKRGWETE
jgi:hypothetical protein